MNARGWLLATMTLALASGCGLHGRPKVERRSAHAQPAASTTDAEIVRAGEVVAPGIVEPWGGEVAVSPRVSGWIARIAVTEGQRVDAGERLATLDDASERAALDAAEADVAEAEALLAKAEHGATPDERSQARAGANAAKARATEARAEATRMRRLGEAGAAPGEIVERATADADVQEALAKSSAASANVVERGARSEDRAAAKARLDAARARRAIAEVAVRRREILAPSAGTVLLSRFHAGEFLDVGGAPMFLLGDLSRLQIRLEVDEIDAPAVRVHARCSVHADGGAWLADATVLRLAPRMGRRALATESPTARTDVRVREVFLEVAAPRELVPGQRVWGHVASAASSRGS